MTEKKPFWDIFCTVIDNYGDIGVTWRLARQLQQEHQRHVRLWIDDLTSFQRLCPSLDPSLTVQMIDQILICRWDPHFPTDFHPREVIIEAFACELPTAVQDTMRHMDKPPIWLNLEYLTAEDWIDGCHGLPSQQQGLTKFFFFPGFSKKSGGLLCESTLFEQRQQWQQNPTQREWFCQQRGLLPPRPQELFISLFSYENAALPALISQWQQSKTPIRCLVPQGRSLNSLQSIFQDMPRNAGARWQQDALILEILPMTNQQGYDELLWSCDFNIVRGEDSFLRAQWAARPFLWHIYPQEENAHLEKLAAFLTLYTAQYPAELADSVKSLFFAFNHENQDEWSEIWPEIQKKWNIWQNETHSWPEKALAGGNLANQLVQFVEKQLECCA